MRTVVVTSDQYLRCLPGFCYYHNKHIGEQQQGIVVCYRPPWQPLPPNFSVMSLGDQADFTWSSGMLEALLHFAADEIIMLMLEDYFVTRADMLAIQALYRHMLVYKDVGKIDLSGDRTKVPHAYYDTINSSIELIRTVNAPYQFSLQAALWRVGFLRDYLRADENPWQMEKGATARYNDVTFRGIEDRKILGTKPAVMQYINAVGGEGRKPGEWDHKKIPGEMWAEMVNRGLA